MEKNLGHATAYGYAKSKGYSGTEEEFAELMADYASVGQSAAQSAEQAAASATSASGSAATASQAAQTATDKASEATTAATTATTRASEASQSATSANQSAESAGTSAQTATTAATTATTKASEASESATTATAAKTDAETARDAAAQSASEAAASAASIDPDEFNRKIYAAFATDTASGSIAHFEDGADNITMKDVLVHIEPVQEGSGDPSPDNVRPITGWTGAKVTRCGKNLLSSEIERYNWAGGVRYINDTGSYCGTKGKVSICGGQTYVASFNNTDTTKSVYFLWFNGDTFLENTTVYAAPWKITAPTNADSVAITIRNANNYIGNPSVSNVQIELGSTATDYEPYSGQTYDITFPSEAGTVYGGTLDVTSGVLTVTDAQIASYAGETLPGEWISDRDVYVAGTTPTTGAQVVYELATPITYQLTPQEITSLLGENNLWADTGDSEVEYRADTKMYIDNLTRSTEDDMIANANISKDAYFTIGNTLYKASVAISAGETIVPNTNCTIVSLADALNTLSASTGGN